MPLRLKFNNADLGIVLDAYSEVTGRTVLQGPGLPKVMITLRSQGELTENEYLDAIEAVLTMNGLGLVKVGDKFLKVVQVSQVRQEEMLILENLPEGAQPDRAELVTQMIPLKHIDVNEAQKVITTLKHTFGQVTPLERTNCILVTDTAAVVNRILQIIRYVDQPTEAPEEANVLEIRFAKAADIKKKLEEIIADSQKDAAKSTVPKQPDAGPPGAVAQPPGIPGIIRAPRKAGDQAAADQTLVDQAERGIISGKVKIIADERTNLLIIITRPENMKFFDKIVKVLDVETAPDVMVKIFRLEFADAEQVASTLNSLIGGKKTDEAGAQGGTTPAKGGEEGVEAARSQALRDYVERLNQTSTAGQKEKSKVGELSATNIKILSDKRTNAILIMASKWDLAAIEEIIKSMDIMLSQVMVEAVIIQVQLDDRVQSGIQWVQRALLIQERGANGGVQLKGSVAGSAGGGLGTDKFIPAPANTVGLTSLGTWDQSAGLTTYFTHFGLNMDVIVKLLKSDSRTRILSAPVISTTDNTKAKISSTEQRYFLKGSTVDQFGNVRPETEIKDIGLTLNVTPHINKTGNVMMEIDQEISDEGPPQSIGDQGQWPTTTKRSFTASIAVMDRETIILGGLVRKYVSKEGQKVPIIGSIPLIGRLFSYKSDTVRNGEVVAFITPYVLDTSERIDAESKRRKDALDVGGLWQRGWSDSDLAEGEPRPPRTRAVRAPDGGAEAVKVVPDAETGTRKSIQVADPMADLDPELVEYIREQETKLGKSTRRVDEQIEQDLKDRPPVQ